MLYLLFHIGNQSYAMDATDVVEVLPLVRVTPLAQAPRFVAGMFQYHGALLPLVDMSEIIVGRPAELKISTRIVLVNCEFISGRRNLIGLLTENLMDTFRRAETEFVDSGCGDVDASYLGGVTTEQGVIVRRVQVDRLLASEHAGRTLRQVTREATHAG
jgi:chemotaxis-related protein WspB